MDTLPSTSCPSPPERAGPARVLANTGYVVGYSDELGNPLWAAYRVRDAEPRPAPPRPDEFAVDMRTVARIDPDTYSRSGYDRGHLAPNFVIATRYGTQAQRETFLMSNIVPQKHALNAGLWKELEQRIATSYPGRFGGLVLKSGSFIFDEGKLHRRPHPVFRRIARLVRAFHRARPLTGVRAFVSTGELEGLASENRALACFLRERGVDVLFKSVWDGHHWHNWRDQLRDGLRWVLRRDGA